MASNIFIYSNLLVCLFCVVASFNLEPSIPVIKVGNNDSYFGFSVAEHITSAGKDGISWLLVGAPLDQNLQPNTTRSGALWKCPLTTSTNDCSQVITDGKRSVRNNGKIDETLSSDKLEPPMKDEIKEGQWLGVSVRSQGAGKIVVVCAHRYITKKHDSQFGQGMCYTLGKDFEFHDLWEPCKGRSVIREHEEYGFCQAGTSSIILNDDTLIIGAPGPYTWRGTIYSHDIMDSYFEQDRNVYFAPVEDKQNSPVEKYSYLGMSVLGAQFFSENFTYVAGAPRSRGTGQVIMFSKTKGYIESTLNYKLALNGEQFGSNFGYEMATADVNGDGLPDLIVGAPFYFSKDAGGAIYLYLNQNHDIKQIYDVKLTGKPESQYGISIANAGDLNRDGCEDIAVGAPYESAGVVYIYMGRRKEGLISIPDQRIEAKHLPAVVNMNTFGYSLSGGIDLDSNGYPDLLVGAYNSHAVVLLRARPIVDIKTSIINNFEERSDIISKIDPSKQGCNKDPSSIYTCFEFQSCCKIESQGNPTDTTKKYPISYTIEAETFSEGKKFSRIFFANNKKKSVLSGKTYVEKDSELCIGHIAYLKNNTRDIQTPIKFQMTYRIYQDLPKYNTKGALPNINDYPVLNATATSLFTANFLNDCGEDNVCISDLVVDPVLLLPKIKDQYTLTLGLNDEVKLEVDVKNYGESAYEPHLLVKHNSSLHFIAVEQSERSIICTGSNQSIVNCQLENPLKETGFPNTLQKPKIVLRFDSRTLEDNEVSVTFEVWMNSTSKSLYPGKKPVILQALVVKNAELSIQGISQPEHVFFGGEVKGETAMKFFDDIGASVIHKYQIYNEGPWRVNSVQVIISWPHQVADERTQGRWLLYPEDIPKVEGEQLDGRIGECFVPKSDINPLDLTHRKGAPEMLMANPEIDPFFNHRASKLRSEKRNASSTYKSFSSSSSNNLRKRRQTDEVTAEALTNKEGPMKFVKNITCENNEAKCINIQCVIYKIERNRAVTITIRSRLWNSTLIEDTSSSVSFIKVASSAKIVIQDGSNIHQNRHNDDYFMVETTAYPDFKITEKTNVPLWVIIISIIVGLLVLIIIVLLLWYFGFFKRSRPDFTLSGNLEKNHESKPFIEENNVL